MLRRSADAHAQTHGGCDAPLRAARRVQRAARTRNRKDSRRAGDLLRAALLLLPSGARKRCQGGGSHSALRSTQGTQDVTCQILNSPVSGQGHEQAGSFEVAPPQERCERAIEHCRPTHPQLNCQSSTQQSRLLAQDQAQGILAAGQKRQQLPVRFLKRRRPHSVSRSDNYYISTVQLNKGWQGVD